MRIIDLTDEHRATFCACLEDWSLETQEAGDHKARWCDTMKDRGLRVKLAVDDDGTVAGMIQYLPIEESWVEGKGHYFIPCVWVHGHRQGIGNRQGRGLGRALLEAAEAEARTLGAKGMAAWGLALPVWMKASWFRRHGYRKVDRDGIAVLLWKPFDHDAMPPAWIRQRKEPPTTPGKVTVAAFRNGWCTAQNLAFERAKRAAADLGERVDFQVVDTSERAATLEWGLCDALFIDGKRVWTGPPPSYASLRQKMASRLASLR